MDWAGRKPRRLGRSAASVFRAPLHSFLSDKGRAKCQGTSRCKRVLFKRSFVLEQPRTLVAQLVRNPPAMQETWV